MHAVGNDEIVILLEMKAIKSRGEVVVEDSHSDDIVDDSDLLIPRDIFIHLNEIYNEAALRGNTISELSYTCPQNATNLFLNSMNYGGFVYIRPSFQCMLDVIVPENPYLIGILIHRFEIPWAKIFPLRLVLRLGAQYRYYPCPHISIPEREAVYGEIAHTIINFLAVRFLHSLSLSDKDEDFDFFLGFPKLFLYITTYTWYVYSYGRSSYNGIDTTQSFGGDK